MKIVFAWELGANLGHLSRQLPVAIEMRARGCDIVFAACDLRVADQLLTPHGFEFVAAPTMRESTSRRPTFNYSQIIAAAGYADSERLFVLTHAWVRLLKEARANVVVADHSPTALVASRILAIPAIQFGAGFFIPPNADPLPTIQPWNPTDAAVLTRADAQILASINKVLESFGSRPLARVADLFADSPAFVASVPELDHYGNRPGVTYVGPVSARGDLEIAPVFDASAPRVIAYVRQKSPGIDAIFGALRRLAAQVCCVVPGATPATLDLLGRMGIKATTRPIDLSVAFAQCDLLVTHGGTGTTLQALLAGIPVLLVPQYIEQRLLALRAVELGAGIVALNRNQHALEQDMQRLLREDSFKHAARGFAQRYAGYDQDAAVRSIATVVESLAR